MYARYSKIHKVEKNQQTTLFPMCVMDQVQLLFCLVCCGLSS